MADNNYKNKSKQYKPNNLGLELGRLQPQAVDLEEAVLGAAMLEKDALSKIIESLSPDSFYKESHKHIYQAIQDLFTNSEPIDMLTVVNQLKNNGKLEEVGGAHYIAQLTTRVASGANIEFHSKIITEKYIKRELIRISSNIQNMSYDDTIDVLELLDKSETELFAVGEKNLNRTIAGMKDLVKKAVDNIEKAKDNEGGLSGIPTGFTDFDNITAGLNPSDLLIVAARPGMGKTAFALTLARNVAVEQDRPVAVFSLEMSAVQLVTRLISSESEITSEIIKKGDLTDEMFDHLNTKVKKLINAPLFIDDTPALTAFELRAKCRRLKQQYNIELVVVDYLQLMSGGGNSNGNRQEEISAISRGLKSLSKELNIPIIALSQLSRNVETRGGTKRPILSDLRESGAIEQDADMVMFLYRPEYYNLETFEDNTPSQGMAELIIAKHRNGPLKDIKLKFIGQFAKFEDPELSFDTENITMTSKMNADQFITHGNDFNHNESDDNVPY